MSLIIKMDAIHTEKHLKAAIPYIMDEKKTKGLYFSNSGVTPEQITSLFFLTKRINPTFGCREGYHYKFSFSKDETISPEDALSFIRDWAEEYLGDLYDYVCSVHQDRDHMHMHLVFNATKRTKGKFHSKNENWRTIVTPLTNKLAEKYKTGPLKKRDRDKDYSSDYEKPYTRKYKGLPTDFSWKELVQIDINECAELSHSYTDFKRKMVSEFHYQLREGFSRDYGLYLSLTPPGKTKAIRTYRLDDGYMPADIEKKIASAHPRRTAKNLLDWMNVSNYAFIPYSEMSPYHQAIVRKMLDAKRLYNRTGASMQMHERSVRALREMKKELTAYGSFHKFNKKIDVRELQKYCMSYRTTNSEIGIDRFETVGFDGLEKTRKRKRTKMR